MASLKNFNPLHTDFCLRLACKVLQEESEKGSNFVYSPLSLHVMLSLIAAGSEGETLEQLLSFLGSQSKDELNSLSSLIVSCLKNDGTERDGGLILSFANGAWVEKTCCLKPSFEEILKYSYKSQIDAVDFIHMAREIVQEVNSWVENATNGLIRHILGPDSFHKYTRLVLANALYFKGAWDLRFDPTKTKPLDFNLLNGVKVKAPFMFSNFCFNKYNYKSFQDFEILSMPYQRGGSNCPLKFSMHIFLPHEKNGLPKLVRSLNSNPRLLNQSFEPSYERVDEIWIPKFKFSFQVEADKDMKELGLTLPFTHEGITGMTDCPIGVSKIVHKAFVEVNEEGTEAAAATVSYLLCGAATPMPPRKLRNFIADHPFMFIIREETSMAVFFIGAVLNPLLDA